jgi:hypothetical protein
MSSAAKFSQVLPGWYVRKGTMVTIIKDDGDLFWTVSNDGEVLGMTETLKAGKSLAASV